MIIELNYSITICSEGGQNNGKICLDGNKVFQLLDIFSKYDTFVKIITLKFKKNTFNAQKDASICNYIVCYGIESTGFSF